MFCKFFAHDLRHGLGDHLCRLGVGFLLFFCLSSYHFLTLRIYELTNPEFFETPVTTGDYFLALTGGCGKVESVPGGGTTFTMPVLWICPPSRIDGQKETRYNGKEGRQRR